MDIHTIDLAFQNTEESIGVFLIETSIGPILIESGPESTFKQLEQALATFGYTPKDIQAVLLTHIHFDHAGAAWKFAQNGTKIFVSPHGIKHLHNPEKLWNSAAMIYGDQMQTLWGTMQPIDQTLLIAADEGNLLHFGDTTIEVLYTPGHAVHHNSYFLDDIIFTGDVAGCKIANGPVIPPCPPPDINIELWKQSIEKIRAKQPKSLYLTHFAQHHNPTELLEQLETELDNSANFIKPYFENNIDVEIATQDFIQFVHKTYSKSGLSEREIKIYEYANPCWMSLAGLLRYWKLRSENRI